MRETMGTASGGPTRPATTRISGLMSALVPRFDESVSPEFYRLSGRLRAMTNLFFIAANVAMAPQLGALGFDPDVHWKTLIAFSAIHVVDLVLAVILWRRATTPSAMRRLTYASVVLETCAVVAASWVYGSVNSFFIGIELVFILIYRLAFDFRVGALAFGLIFVGQWAVVGAELAGALPPQPIGANGEIDAVYTESLRHLGSMVYLSIVMGLTFVVANWAVARMRHKDLAIRLLRESLYASDQGSRVGRHTGRTLRDTYTVGTLIGAGGMGEVYLGHHVRTRRKVAIKLLHPHLLADNAVLGRFRREAEVTGRLGSEHIVGVIDIDQDDGQPFMVLEYMDGESLAARIATSGPLGPIALADVVDHVAAGLDLAHRAGIVHRDLKPDNIFLCPRRDGGVTAKILDFGVSKIRGNATQLTGDIAIVGTPDYMSPEQAIGAADEVEASSDVWALGCVTYTALTGHRPFDAPSIPALLRQICDDEPPAITDLRPELQPGVADVIAVALAKKPAERYATAPDFARDLRAALTGQTDDKLRERARRVTRGRPTARRLAKGSISATGETQPA
jgi:tRNA A-37 threonylcarbamoyl transferase component Bud32